ncbi:MAG: oxidoreductase [Actinomycetota bacterium]
MTARRPTLAVWKFASCDGCQLSLLDCEDELLEIAGAVDIAYFLEASTETVDGPYDVSLVEGSVATAADEERIRAIRRQSTTLVTIGACATAGGIQALRNFAEVGDYLSIVYAHPEHVDALATSTPIAEHVPVDLELRGCPISRSELVGTIAALLHGGRPPVRSHSVCVECKRRGLVCVTVADGTPCLGPVTHAGCEALCPAYRRGCYGCFGPMDHPNTAAMVELLERSGLDVVDRVRLLRTFNAAAPAFSEASVELERRGGAS